MPTNGNTTTMNLFSPIFGIASEARVRQAGPAPAPDTNRARIRAWTRARHMSGTVNPCPIHGQRST